MFVLVAYDIATGDQSGKRRLREVANTCLQYGYRVQKSVFEFHLDEETLYQLRTELLDVINREQDSIRLYRLPSNYENYVEEYGRETGVDFDETLIF